MTRSRFRKGWPRRSGSSEVDGLKLTPRIGSFEVRSVGGGEAGSVLRNDCSRGNDKRERRHSGDLSGFMGWWAKHCAFEEGLRRARHTWGTTVVFAAQP